MIALNKSIFFFGADRILDVSVLQPRVIVCISISKDKEGRRNGVAFLALGSLFYRSISSKHIVFRGG